MKGIVHIRVDDRLIHGQVATRWVGFFNANRIMIIDDEVANNDIEKTMLRSAAPEGCNTSILPFDKAVNNIKQGNYDKQNVLILIKTPKIALEMLEAGLDIKQVNIGNMSNREGRKQIKRSVSLSTEEVTIVNKLLDCGVNVTARMTPDEAETDIRSFLDKKE